MTCTKLCIAMLASLAMTIGCGDGKKDDVGDDSDRNDPTMTLMCANNLSGICKACSAAIADDRKQRFPADLDVLVKKQFIPSTIFKCPSDKSDSPCSYVYAAPVDDMDPRIIIISDKAGNYAGGRNVGRADGSVVYMTEAKFQEALKLPHNTAFAAALKKAGG